MLKTEKLKSESRISSALLCGLCVSALIPGVLV